MTIATIALAAAFLAGIATEKVPLKTGWRFVKGDDPAVIVATDNGDETDFDDFRQDTRKTFNGLAQAIVRVRPGATGNVSVKVLSDGLESAEVSIGIVTK